MTIRRSSKSTEQIKKAHKARKAIKRSKRDMQLESLEDRQMLAGAQLIGIQPNDGALLQDQDVRNVAPSDLTFLFDETQDANGGIAVSSLGDSNTIGGIQITRSGFDDEFAAAAVQHDLNTGGLAELEITAVRLGQDQNGIRLIFSKSDHGGPGLPNITVNTQSIFVNLNTNVGNETTADDLAEALNTDLASRNLVSAAVIGDGAANVAAPQINYSPLELSGANDVVVHPGFIGLGENLHEVIVRFGEALPDDVYRIEVFGDGPTVLRNGIGEAFQDGGYQQIDFSLDLGAQIVSVTPQPVSRDANGNLVQERDKIVVYFNNDDLDITSATNADFYQLIFTNDTVENTDDTIVNPTAISYDPVTDIVELTFADDIDKLVSGSGTYRLRIGTDEVFPTPPEEVEVLATASSDLGTGGLVDVNFESINEPYGKALELHFRSEDLGGAAAPEVEVFDHQIEIVLNSNAGNESNATDVILALNTHFRASQLVLATIASGNPLATVGGIATDYSPLQMNGLGSSFDTAFQFGRDLDASGFIVSSAIDPQVYRLDFPGGNDEPGHRDVTGNHLPDGATDAEAGITTVPYNFSKIVAGFFNIITENQRNRAREIFQIYSDATGVQFYETESEGIIVYTGDPLVRPFAPNAMVMDAALFDKGDDQFGAQWALVAMEELGAQLGLGAALDLPALQAQGTANLLNLAGGPTPEIIDDVTGLPFNTPGQEFDNKVEPIFPRDHDIIHLHRLFNPEAKDIDIYRFTIDVDPDRQGVFTAETIAERQQDSSQLDTALVLYRENADGSREVIAKNDDYFSNDSYIELDLEAGTYFIGVSASGNTEYDPVIQDSGIGGKTQGKYDLRLHFRVDAEEILRDDPVEIIVTGKGSNFLNGQTVSVTNQGGTTEVFEFSLSNTPAANRINFNSGTTTFELTQALVDAINATGLGVNADAFGSQIRFEENATDITLSPGFFGIDADIPGTRFDGDADGSPGGTYNFWFRAQAIDRTLTITGDSDSFVDGDAITLTDSGGNVETFEFNDTTVANASRVFGSNPVDYSPGDDADAIAASLATAIGNAGFGVTVSDITGSVVTIDGDRTLTTVGDLREVSISNRTIFVDKLKDPELNNDVPANVAVDGSPDAPFYNIAAALQSVRSGDTLRIVGNAGLDGDILTLEDNLSYQVGFNSLGNPLPDGATFQVPQGVTVMIDSNAIFQIRRARIGVGSSQPGIDRGAGALQILGTPRMLDENGAIIKDADGNNIAGHVYFTSYNDTEIGLDTNDFDPTTPAAGDWGGIVFRDDIDRATGSFLYSDEGIFLNNVNHADIRYGGGNINIASIAQVITPIHITDTQPTITHNRISVSADAAMSATPNSFEELNFHAPRHQSSVFTSDYARIGPDIHANDTIDNSINGLFIRISTPAGNDIERLTVSGRFDDTDIVHVISENLVIQGQPGGALEEFDPPPILRVISTPQTGGDMVTGLYSYRIVFVDEFGQESIASNEFGATILPGVGDGSIQLENLPEVTPGSDFVARHLYRTDEFGNGPFVRIAELGGLGETYVDDGIDDRLRVGTPDRLLESPSVSGTTLTPALGGILQEGFYNYKFTFLDRFGNESMPTSATIAIPVNGNPNANGNPGFGSILLENLPQSLDPAHTQINIYRSDLDGLRPYSLITTLPIAITDFNDFGAFGTTPLHELSRPRQDGRLTVDPSIVVKLDGARIESEFTGQLIAEGRDGLEVIFTSIRDDRYGAGNTFDTSNDGLPVPTINAPLPGDWGGIFIGHTSSVSIDHAVIAYAGGINRVEGTFVGFNALEIHQSTARVANSIFEFNANGTGGQGQIDRFGRGFNEPGVIFVRGSQPVIYSNVIRNNNGPAININANSLNATISPDPGRSTGELDRVDGYRDNQGPLILDNRIGNNTINGMVVRGETLTTESVWDDTDVVHVLLETIYIPDYHTYGGIRFESSPNESLVVKLQDQDPTGTNPNNLAIDPPNFAGFWAFGRPLEVNDRIGGILQVVGQPGSPVVFTSLADDNHGAGFAPNGDPQNDTNNDGGLSTPFPGEWRGLRLDRFSHDRNVEIITEFEPRDLNTPGSNAVPDNAQFLGQLAPRETASDENLRVGYVVHGFLNDPADIDVFSFTGESGTEVWLDIDRTTHALDAVIEVIDGDGTVVARSDNSMAEREGREDLFSANGVEAFTMDKAPQWEIEDTYSTNPRDPGMRFILSGGLNTNNTYHVRIRSGSDDLSDINGGLTSGAYELQVRIREIDEVAGSTVRFGTIAYANNGIEALGLPTHSPLAGEIAEPNEDPTLPDPANPQVRTNDTFATAVDIGNLLRTDRSAFSIAGNFLTATDVDWYSFDVIDEVGGNGATYPVTFDIDYSDGLSRAPAGLSVFDANGTLILVSLASNIGDDRPEPIRNDNLEDLTRGTVGSADALIGPIELPVGQTYFVAVYGQGMGPTQLNSNPYARIEPIESVNRIVEDRVQPYERITFQPPILGSATPEDPTDEERELFDVASPVNFHLGDVPLYVSQDWDVPAIPSDTPWDLTRLITIDPFTGAPETTVNEFGSGAVRSFIYDVGDIALASDGNFYSYSLDLEDPDGLSDAESGNFIQISPADGTAVNLGDDGILTYEGNFLTDPPTPIRANLVNNQRVGYGVQFHAIDFLDHPFTGQKNGYFGIAIGNRGDGEINPLQQNGVNAKTNLLYLFDPTTGGVFQNPGGETLQSGDRLPLRGDAATDAIEVGEVLTSARLTGAETTFTSFIPDPTDPNAVIPEPGVASNFLIQDRGLTTFEIFDGIGTTIFEMDFGPEIRQEVNTFTNGNIDFRFVVDDGNFFELDPNINIMGDEVIYQLDTGPVLEILRSDIEDGQIITVSAGSFTGIFEFDLDGTVNNSAAIAVDINGFVDPTAIAGILAQIINGEEVSSRGGVLATAVGPRVTFEAERGVTIAPAPSTPGALPTQMRIVGSTDINPILEAVSGDNIQHLDNITMRIANFNDPLVFEFARDGMAPSGTADVVININSTDDADFVAQKIHNAINGFARAISTQLVGDRVVITAQGTQIVSTNSPIVDITNTLETHLIAIEETMWNHDLGVTVANQVNITSGFLASAEGTRINFSPAGVPVQAADFNGVPNWTDIGSATGVVPGNVPVYVNAADDEAAAIQAIAAAINNALSPGVTAIAGLSSLRLNTGQLTADAPLVARGEGPGGIIQGVTQTAGGGIFAVSDAGGLYEIQFPIPVSNDPLDYPSFNDPLPFETGSVTYVQSSESDLLGIEFVGLTEGPRSTEGRYANMLFGMDADGRLYAFNTNGVLQPVFANGASSIETGLTNINGIEFGNLEGNLWGMSGAHAPTSAADFGHGTDPTFNGARSDLIGVPDMNWNFGGYTQTGGAYGTMVSNPFSLAGYSASDIPALFFNFYSEKGPGDVVRAWITENNGPNVGGTADGEWIPLITDVVDQSNGWAQVALNLGGFAGLEELQIRFDFSSHGELNIGDPFSIGSELRAPRGVYLEDGDIFTIGGQIFELDSGITLVMPSGDSILPGEQFTVDDGTNQVTFQFDDDFTFPSNIELNVDGSQFFDGQSFTIDDGQGTPDSVQTFELDSGFVLEVPADGSLLTDGETFEITDNGNPVVFEFDNDGNPTGNTVVNIRDNYGIVLPVNGAVGVGAVQDQERFFIELDGNGPVWFEFDSNGSTNPSSDQIINIAPQISLQVPVRGAGFDGVQDGEQFEVWDQGTPVTFEFVANGRVPAANVLPIEIDHFNTQEVLADNIVAAINVAVGNADLPANIMAVHRGGGLVVFNNTDPGQFAVATNTQIVANFVGLNKDELAARVIDQINLRADLQLEPLFDGDVTIVLNNTEVGHVVNSQQALNINEVDDLPKTQDEIADRIRNAILAANIGLAPQNLGGGLVHVGGTVDHQMDVVDTANLTLREGRNVIGQTVVGAPGLANPVAVAVEFLPTDTADQIAQAIAQAINDQIAALNPDWMITGATAVGNAVQVGGTGNTFSPGTSPLTPEGVAPIRIDTAQTAFDVATLVDQAIQLQILAGNLNVTTTYNNHEDLDSYRIQIGGAIDITQTPAPQPGVPIPRLGVSLDGEFGLNLGNLTNRIIPFNPGMTGAEVATEIDTVLETFFADPAIISVTSTDLAVSATDPGDGERFTLNDSNNPTVAFEFDMGMILQVPTDGGNTVPTQTTMPQGIKDGDTFTISFTNGGAPPITFEFDKNDGAFIDGPPSNGNPDNTIISITENSSQLQVANAIAQAVAGHPLAAIYGVTNAQTISGGRVHFGASDGVEVSFSVDTSLAAIDSTPGLTPDASLLVPAVLNLVAPAFPTLHIPNSGFVDGETFTLGNGIDPDVTFEFDFTPAANGFDMANVPIPFDVTDDGAALATRIATEINNNFTDMIAQAIGSDVVLTGTEGNHTIFTQLSHVQQSGITGPILDEDQIVIGNTANNSSVTFEFDNDGSTVSLNPLIEVITFDETTTQQDIVNLLIAGINNQFVNLDMNPEDMGNGEIHLGAVQTNLVDPALSNFQSTGIGEPFLAGQTFTIETAGAVTTFTFDNNINPVASTTIPTVIDSAAVGVRPMTQDELAEAISAAINAQAMGVFGMNDGDGVVSIQATTDHIFNIATPNLGTDGFITTPAGLVPPSDVVAINIVPTTNVRAGDVAIAIQDAINLANAGGLIEITATINAGEQSRVTLTHDTEFSIDMTFDALNTPLQIESLQNDIIKQDSDLIRIILNTIQDPGPLGFDGCIAPDPNDPTLCFPAPAAPNDLAAFGIWDSAPPDRVGFHNPSRGQDNAHEGVYLDDFIIGFAERGLLVSSNVDSTDTGIGGAGLGTGHYQLEIRQATTYGPIGGGDATNDTLAIALAKLPNVTVPNIVESLAGPVTTRSFDTNDRLTQGVTLIAQAGAFIYDGQTFTISDGVDSVTFEYDDQEIRDGVTPGNIEVPFRSSDRNEDVALAVLEKINGPDAQSVLDITGGLSSHDGLTDSKINLYGPVSLETHAINVDEINDTIATAVQTGIDGSDSLPYLATSFLGDNPNFPLMPGMDVDLFQVRLTAGETLKIDIDGQEDGSDLDPILYVFNSFGLLVAANDELDPTDPIQRELLFSIGELGSLDPYLEFVAPTTGIYYIGINGVVNKLLPIPSSLFNPSLEGSGALSATTGFYNIELTFAGTSRTDKLVFDSIGDGNLFRDQGQVILHGNTISNSANFGIRFDAGTRDGGEGTPHPGAARNLRELNTDNLVPSVVISNNLIYNSGVGGILFSGDAGGLDEIGAAVPFGRIVNNTIVGVGGNLGFFPGFILDTGIQVEENASPTILNNIVSNFNQGISVDALSTSTVVGGSLYHANISSNNIAVEDFPLTIADTDPLFVDFAAENFYLSANSEAIDSSIGSLLDRADLVRVKNPHNIAESPIIAPATDLTGQLRVDDPSVEPPSGFGENVFIDRGAIDRTDFTGPTLNLVAPRDNDAAMVDSNPAPTVLELPADLALSNFRIELLDGVEPADPQDGTGVDDSTVTNEAVEITRDGVLLEEGIDYTFSYNSTSDTIVLTPLSGIWEPDHIYVVTLNNTDRFEIRAPSGDIPVDYDPLTDSFNRDGEQFTITDAGGTVETFEWESGYTLQVPQTLQLILPQEGGNVGGIQDTNTFTISDGTNFLIFEFDSNQTLNNSNHVRVPYLGSSTLDEIATSIIDVLATTPFDLSPVNLGNGVIHLGAGNTVSVNTFGTPRLGTSQTINPDTFLPQDGVVDGDIFTVDDGTKVETFEFDSDGIFVDTNNDTLPDFNVISFNQSQTNVDIAVNVAASVNGADVNLTALALNDGRIHLGGTIAHLVSVDGSNGHVLIEGAPGATPGFGMRIPTVAGAPDGILDGMQFTLENTASNTSFIFEFDRVDDPTQVGSASPNAIPITANSSTDDIANAIVAAISNVDLDLEPTNDGNGIINLGGSAVHVLTIPVETNLIRLGQAGQPAAVPITFQPSAAFSGTQMAVQLITAINNSPRLTGVAATPGGAELVVIEGAAAIDDVDGVLNRTPNGLGQIGAIRDFAGNQLKPNQFSGETKVSIVLGDVDLDFGDAPDPEFPTLFRSNGSIHVLSGQTFLGSGMDVETEALQNINADGDALDDGVVFLGIINPFVDTPIEVTVSVDGLIDAWVDYNRDGDWDDVGEQIFASQEVFAEPNGTAGPNSLAFRAPGGIELGTTTYTRFRFSTTGGLLPTGLASDGEVEDYEVPLAIGSPPTANDDNSYTISENAMLTATAGFGVLTNDTDAETPASVRVVEFDANSELGAAVIVNSDGSFTYDPTGASALQLLRNSQTAHDTFTYTISDGQFGRDTATVNITVMGDNDDPTPQDDTIGTDEDTGVTFNVLPNDTDPDNTTAELTVVDFDATFATGIVTFNTSNNRFTYLPNGQFEFVPVNGTATDTFTYTVEDLDGATATATVTIVISGLNSDPTGVDDTATTDQDTAIDIDVAANDVDPDGDALVIHTIDDSGTTGAVGPFTAGTITYDPNGQFNSLADGELDSDTFTYRVRDNNGGFTSASVTVTITGTNDDPVAVSDDISSGAATDNATPVSIDVLANDIDVDNGDQLTLIAVNGAGTAGTVAVDSGQVTYDPNGQFNGLNVGETATDTFTYVVQDSSGAVSTGTVTVTVSGFNEDPVANADSDATDEDTSIAIDVIANDTDGEGHALTVIDVSSVGTIGRVIVTGDGSTVTFDPRGRFDGLQVGETFNDTFTYTVRDEFGGTSTGTVTVSVDGVNDDPIGRADSYDVLIGRTFNGSSVLVNDSDDDSNMLTAQIVTPTLNGILNLNADGTFTYNTTTTEVGTDAFTYRVLDENGGQSDPVVVTLDLARSKWQNPLLHNDVNADGGVSPLDALIVINYINSNGNTVPADPAAPPPYYDVDGDGSVTPNDVIIIVNYLNRQANPGLGEAIVEVQPEAEKSSTEPTTVVEQVEERSFAPLRRDIQVARAMEQMRTESDDTQMDDLVDDIVEAGLDADVFDAAIDKLFG